MRDAISTFDGFLDALLLQLVARVPLTRARLSFWQHGRPRYKLRATLSGLDEHFGFQTLGAISQAELQLAERLTAHRHLHEHRGAIVDARYIEETGDQTVRVGQKVREDKGEVFQLLGILGKIATAISDGFHELFPPDQPAIDRFKRRCRPPGA